MGGRKGNEPLDVRTGVIAAAIMSCENHGVINEAATVSAAAAAAAAPVEVVGGNGRAS